MDMTIEPSRGIQADIRQLRLALTTEIMISSRASKRYFNKEPKTLLEHFQATTGFDLGTS